MQTLKDDIRQRIIATARAEFIAHGVRCTSIRTVARKSGVAVGNLYNYFSSKDELFCEVLRPLTKSLNKHILSHNDEKFLSIDVFNMRQHQIDYIFAMLAMALSIPTARPHPRETTPPANSTPPRKSRGSPPRKRAESPIPP